MNGRRHDIQHNDTQHKGLVTLNINLLLVSSFFVYLCLFLLASIYFSLPMSVFSSLPLCLFLLASVCFSLSQPAFSTSVFFACIPPSSTCSLYLPVSLCLCLLLYVSPSPTASTCFSLHPLAYLCQWIHLLIDVIFHSQSVHKMHSVITD